MSKKKTASERAAERRTTLYLRFAAIYCSNGRNATQAYIATHPGVRANSAGTNGGEWLRNTEVQNEIKRLTDETLKREHMSADEALALTARIARLNPQEFYWSPGELTRAGETTVSGIRKPLSELTPEQARCIAGFKHTMAGTDLLFRDADSSLHHVLKHHKLLNDKLEVSGADGAPIEIRWAGEPDAKT